MRYTYRFVLQILFTIALVFIILHGQAIWLNLSEYGFWGAIRMEFAIASPVIIVAIIVVSLTGFVTIRDQRRMDKESHRNIKLHEGMNKTLKAILKRLGGDIDDTGHDKQ